MENPITQNPDPVIVQPLTPVMPREQIAPIPSSTKVTTTTVGKLGEMAKENKKLMIAIILFVIALISAIILIVINSRQGQTVDNTKTIVSAPVTNIVSKPTGTTTPTPTPTSTTTKTLNIQVDNAFAISQKPYDSLKGTIVVDSDVTFSNPTPYEGLFKKGSSSFKIWNFSEESDHKLIDSKFIGTTKTLGNTYRLTQAGQFEGSMEYFYVQPNVFKSTGTCNPTSYPAPIEAPCGRTNYKGYYFQCTGDINFSFCDKIITDLDFTITLN